LLNQTAKLTQQPSGDRFR